MRLNDEVGAILDSRYQVAVELMEEFTSERKAELKDARSVAATLEIDQELTNLIQLLDLVTESVEIAPYATVRSLFTNIETHLTLRGLRDEKLRWSQRLQVWEMHINDDKVDIGVLNGQANAYLEQGRYDVAIHLFHHLIEHIRDIPALRHSLARIYVNLGIAYRKSGQLDEAAEVTEAGLQMESENDGEPRTIAIFMLNLAQLRADQDRFAEALDLTRQARAIIEQIGDELLHGECLYVLGNHLLLNGYETEAAQIYGLTLQLASRTQNELVTARVQFSLARLWERQGDVEGAWALAIASAKIFEAYAMRGELDNTLRFLKRLHSQRDTNIHRPDQHK